MSDRERVWTTWFPGGSRPQVMSEHWRRTQLQLLTRVSFDGPAITFPIQKDQDDQGWRNRIRLKVRA